MAEKIIRLKSWGVSTCMFIQNPQLGECEHEVRGTSGQLFFVVRTGSIQPIKLISDFTRLPSITRVGYPPILFLRQS